jgi:hypothetical protein
MPIAVVAARHIPLSVAEQIQQFGRRYAPEVGVGIIDAEGFRSFAGAGLEGLDAKPHSRFVRHIASAKRLPDLFSDLNQWMLKILLGQHLPESLLSIPRQRIRNTSQLADVARVSMMSASRLVSQLINEGYIDEHEDYLHVVRADDLRDIGAWPREPPEVAGCPCALDHKEGREAVLSECRPVCSRVQDRPQA